MSFAIPYPSMTFVGVTSGSIASQGEYSLGVQRSPTDPIGSMSLTLVNLVDGSSVQIEPQAGGATFHNSVVSGTSKTVVLSVYSPGSPFNSLRIKVRKGSAAPYYQPYETLATAVVGSLSIYVSQIPD